MQITLQTVNTLVLGLTQVKNEVQQHQQSKETSLNDTFVQVMQVNYLTMISLCALCLICHIRLLLPKSVRM